MKKAILVFAALALLALAACGAAPPENVLSIPAGILPQPEEKPLETGKLIPRDDPWRFPHFTPFENIVSPDYQALSEDSLWVEYLLTENLRNFLAEELPDRVVDDIDRQADGSWRVFGWRLEGPGELYPYVMLAWVTPLAPVPESLAEDEVWTDMDFSLDRLEEIPVDETWSAVARYRVLISAMAGGLEWVLQTLGLDDPEFHRLDPWPRTEDGFYPTDLSYDAAAEAIGRHMPFSNFETAGLLTSREGKLWYRDFGASGFHYWPDRVEQQADGSLLSYEHYYDFLRRRHEYVVSVQLEELEDGSLRVSYWNPDNQALMEDYQPALPGGERFAPAADLP